MCVDKKLFHWLCVGWLGHFPCVKAFPCFYFLFFFLMIKNYLYIQSVHFSCLLSLWCSKVLTYSFLSFLCAECTCTKCLFYFILQFNKPNTLIRSVYFGLVIFLIEIKFIFLWTAFFFFAPNCDLYVRGSTITCQGITQLVLYFCLVLVVMRWQLLLVKQKKIISGAKQVAPVR